MPSAAGTKRRTTDTTWMKKNKKKKTTRKAVVTRFNRTRYGNSTTINKMKFPLFGSQLSCKMIYAERAFSINPGLGGTVATHVFRANSIFDPDFTGVGHQPTGFDQIMQFFQFYTVQSAKIFIDGNNTDGGFRQYLGVYIDDDSTPSTDFREIIENGRGTYTILNASGGDGDATSLDLYCNIGQYSGRPSVLSEDHARGTISTNPVEQIFFVVWAVPDSASDSGPVTFNVRIEYQVTFTEPKPAPIS